MGDIERLKCAAIYCRDLQAETRAVTKCLDKNIYICYDINLD